MQGGQSNISNEELANSQALIRQLTNYYSSRMVGQAHMLNSLLVAFLTNSHILVESVPGLAKTTAIKILAGAVNGKFSKIQCTPDLLPSDIVGTQVFNYSTNNFETRIGPINANFILLDEVNRSSAKTQSAMLEAMAECQVSIGGETYKMPRVFVVMATQNPIEQEGTYLLAEAQLDRFLLKETITYPTFAEEIEVMNRIENKVIDKNEPIMNINDVVVLQELCDRVYVDNAIKEYIANIIYVTRNAKKYIAANLAEYIEMGASPRGSIALMKASKAAALINGRTYVTPDDVKQMAKTVLRHRILLNYSATADNVNADTIIDAILKVINTP